jgi:phage gpG-like protein
VAVRQVSGMRLEQLVSNIHALSQPALHARLAQGLGAESLKLVKHGFEVSQDPYGRAWKKPVLRDGKPLLDTNRLKNGWTVHTAPLKVELQNAVPYAWPNNYGATIKAKKGKYLTFKTPSGFARKEKVVLPARPMLPTVEQGLPPSWRDPLTQIAERIMREQVLGGR